MKKGKKLVFTALLLGIMFMLMGAMAVQARDARLIGETLWIDNDDTTCIRFDKEMPATTKIVSIKSSDPSVIKVHKYGSELFANALEPCKVGDCVITVKYKAGSKTKNVKAQYSVKKYPNAFKKITVNGKAADIKKNHYSYTFSNFKKKQAKVVVTMRNGWTIKSAETAYWDLRNTIKGVAGKKTATMKLSVANNHFLWLHVTAGNAAGETITYSVCMMKNEM